MVSGAVGTTSAFGVTVIVVLVEAVCEGLLLSVTVATKVEVPLLVGAPEMVPVDGVRINPAGKLPELIVHVYGAVPPAAWRALPNAVPTGPEGRLALVIVSGVGNITRLPVTDADCTGLLLSFTVAMKAEDPLVVGVPDMTPAEDSARPAGKLPDAIDQL
jgi:hypothetical protein